jgi:hypothetical protein
MAATLLGLSLGWRWSGPRFFAGLEVRSGALWLAGIGYPVDQSEWLVWLEAAPSAGVNLGGGWLIGAEVAVAPLRYTGRVALERRDVSFLRFGVWVQVPLFGGR